MTWDTFESREARLLEARKLAGDEAAAAWLAVRQHPLYHAYERAVERARQADNALAVHYLNGGIR